MTGLCIERRFDGPGLQGQGLARNHVRNVEREEIIGVRDPQGSMDQDFEGKDWLETTLGMSNERGNLGSLSMVAPGPIWIFENTICQDGGHEFQNEASGHQDSAWTSELFLT
ncbi:unnamed protein product [Caenorhabditis nigoni]